MADLAVGLANNLQQVNRFAAAPTAELWLCSAYVNDQGVTAMAPLLRSSGSARALLGAGPLTDPAALRSLETTYRSDVRLVPHGGGSEFHPKCYLGLRRDGSAWAAVGSANLTGRGAGENVELLATVEGAADHPFFTDLTDWLAEVESFALKLTPDLLAALEEVRRAYGPLSDATAQASQDLAAALQAQAPGSDALTTARALVDRLQREALLQYIQSTRLFASYKLVILGLLLKTVDGRLGLSECARRFQAFYLGLEAAGVQPERGTGVPPPLMLRPSRLAPAQVEQLLMDAPRTAFHGTGGVVLFREGGPEVRVMIARSLWRATDQPSREEAFGVVLQRLEEYYLQHVGSLRAVRAALVAAAEGCSCPELE